MAQPWHVAMLSGTVGDVHNDKAGSISQDGALGGGSTGACAHVKLRDGGERQAHSELATVMVG